MGFSQFHVMQSKCQLAENCLSEKPRETITPLETEGVLQKEERTMITVYVLSKGGKTLMPTTRCGHVRILLKEKKALVVERCRKSGFTGGKTIVKEGLSQILCKHRNAVQIEQNLFKAEVAQAAAALFSK